MAFSPSTSKSAMFGRDGEKQRLRGALTSVVQGHGGLVLINGEAGIGKTTLARDLARTATGRDALVLTGHCYDLTTTPPYGPWLEIIRKSPHVEGLPSLSEIIAGDGDYDDASPGRGDELFNWGRDLFGKLSSNRPLVLILEDIHWADRASLDFLRFLSRALSDLSILLVATYRADEIVPGHPLYILLPSIIRESEPERIDLQPLNEKAVCDWVSRYYSLSPPAERRLVEYLQRHAEGNPFFASEILRELEANAVLREVDDGWQLDELVDVGVPALLRQMLETRIGRLSTDAREALGLASIIGQEVAIALWQRLGSLSNAQALEVDNQASKLALIDLSNDGRQFSFCHALIREALYEEILPPRRRIIHRQIAEALIETTDPDPDAVAHHLQQADDPRAAEWLIKAGDRAYYQAYSLKTAITRYEAALEALPTDALENRGWLLVQIAQTIRYLDPRAGVRFADEAVQISARIEDGPLRAVALRNRGICRVYAGENVLDDLICGYDLIDELAEHEVRVLEDRRQGRRIDTALGRQQMALWYATIGDYDRAIRVNQRSFAKLDVDSPNSATHAAILHWGAGFTHASLGSPERAVAAFRRSREAFRATHQDFHSGTVITWEFKYATLPYSADKIESRVSLAEELLSFGQNDLSRVTNDPPDVFICPLYLIDGRWDELGRIEQDSSYQATSVFFLFGALTSLAEYHLRIGSVSKAQQYIQDWFPLGPDVPPEESLLRYAEALDLLRVASDLEMDQGRIEEARKWINTRQKWLDWSGRVPGRAEQSLLEARYAILADTSKQARDHAIEAVRHAENPRQPLALLRANLMLGKVLTQLGDYEDANTSLQRALRLADSCQAPYESGLAQIALAELHILTGSLDAASKESREAKKTFTGLQAEPALHCAVTLQNRIHKTSGKRDINTAGLSDREIEVLQLVAAGLTDREIGAQLFISPRTVGQHMRSVFNKLDVNTRTAAAVKATELDLLEHNDA